MGINSKDFGKKIKFMGKVFNFYIKNNLSIKGYFTMYNGDKFDGEFKENHIHGYGVSILKNGDSYEGDWE